MHITNFVSTTQFMIRIFEVLLNITRCRVTWYSVAYLWGTGWCHPCCLNAKKFEQKWPILNQIFKKNSGRAQHRAQTPASVGGGSPFPCTTPMAPRTLHL